MKHIVINHNVSKSKMNGSKDQIQDKRQYVITMDRSRQEGFLVEVRGFFFFWFGGFHEISFEAGFQLKGVLGALYAYVV